MAWLYKRDDAETANKIRDELAIIIKAAFAGEAAVVYGHLTRLACDTTLDCNDPAFTFPMQRCAEVEGTNVKVTAALRPNSPGGNRVMQFDVAIKASDWSLNGCVKVEAAKEATSWIFTSLLHGYCSNRDIALPGLKNLSEKPLTFSRCT